ncbi:MAG TPA: DUF2314 domain-containing protein [Burkholderiaceae bacterium]
MKQLIRMLALSAGAICAAINAQEGPLAPNTAEDQPRSASSDEAYRAMERATAPYVAMARETYPDAKRRFISGQLGTRPFFVTVRLAEDGRYEDSFVRVLYIDEKSGDISGRIANDIQMLHNYRNAQRIIVREADVRDWSIANPDGSMEGNIVGKFLEGYQP